LDRVECLFLTIVAILAVSFVIPHYTHSPPLERFVDSTVGIHEKPAEWVSYVECIADTSSYYGYVVNWTLGYPHDHGFSELRVFKTTLLVGNWSEFIRRMPVGCDVLGRDRLPHNNSLQMASERLKNLTEGTPDYEKLKPFFAFAGSPKEPANLTRVHVTVFYSGDGKPVKEPFLIVWLAVLLIGIAGFFASYRKNKALTAVFLVVILLSSLFLGNYFKTEEKISGAKEAFHELLNLNTTGAECTEVGGASGWFHSRDDVRSFLKTLGEYNATVNSVIWEDYTLRIRVGVDKDNYKKLLALFRDRGWEISEVDIKNSSPPEAWIRETNNTLITLEKYLPYLAPDERKAVERYMVGLRESLRTSKASKNLCIAVFTANPETMSPGYGTRSDFLAKLVLFVVGVGMLVLKRGEENES